jgi:glycerol-3-phosphate acyltransferase PlsY
MSVLPWLTLAAGAYLLGAVPFGLLIGLARGVDIRKTGSRNIGATNVFRAVGKGWGVLAFTCDALKGLLPAVLCPLLLRAWTGAAPAQGAALLFGAAAIAGHNWPVYLGFRGGKGIATSAGALIGIAPLPLAVGAAIWLAVFLLGRYVSLASIAAAVAMPAAAWLLPRADGGWLLPAALTALGALAILRHRPNITRLMRGTEHRFEFRRAGARPAKGQL